MMEGGMQEDEIAKKSETCRAALRAALIKGEKSGPSAPFDFDAFIEKKRVAAALPAKPGLR
jgi:Arc/MetJ-type ribon-helix-helix transcriptional regulator